MSTERSAVFGLVSGVVVALSVMACANTPQPAARVAVPPTPRATASAAPTRSHAEAPTFGEAEARHVLNRFAFGARPGEAEALSRAGFPQWLDAQLAPDAAPNPLLDVALAPYAEALSPPAALVTSWLGDDWADSMQDGDKLNRRIQPYAVEHLRKLALAEVTRHVLSHRQLEEVMVDFWANHFNVFAKKGLVRLLAGDYVERSLRPRALGRFSDILLATAQHPAMLIYLDNDQSSRADPSARRGINENYARELLELHTLGVDGGYTQHDVIEVARVLTGWSVKAPRLGQLSFAFKKARHDAGEKTLLGQTFPAGHGEDEGVRLLALLAQHPATARHLARKLCALFVADEPPASCVAAAERAYLESSGEIGSVIRAIAADPSFWAADNRDQKLKTPLEFVASALRATGSVPDGSTDLARALERLGEPILQESVPTGYPEAEAGWASSNGMLSRMNFAMALAFGRASGVRSDVATLLPDADTQNLAELANRVLLSGAASGHTLAVIDAALAQETSSERRRSIAVALLIGGPEFQRQ